MASKEWQEKNVDKLREYRRDWYERNKEAERAKARVRARALRRKNLDIIIATKSVPCADCKIQYPPYVMHFDHVRGVKRDGVSRLTAYSTSTMLKEIEKCEVVCGNCHAERTWG